MVSASDKLVEAVYEVASYTPSEKTPFWTDEVQPKLVQALIEDIKMRNEVSASFASIVVLANVINETGALVKSSKGSDKAIEIARLRIPQALARLHKHMAVIEKSKNSALELFEKHAEDILGFVGAAAIGQAANDVHAFESQKDAVWKKLAVLSDAYGSAKAAVLALDNLLGALAARLLGNEAAAAEAKQRQSELAEKIKQTEQAMDDIPLSKQATATTTALFGVFRWHHTTTVANHDRDAQRNYLNSLIVLRESRIKESQKTIDEQRKALDDEYAATLERRKKARETLETAAAHFATESPKLKQEIVELDDKIAAIKANVDSAECKVNLRGGALIDCLVACKAFSKGEKAHVESYQPLYNILDEIASRAQASVDMLGGTKEDVFIAGARLLSSVGFLQQTSITLKKAVNDTHEHNQQVVAIEFKAKKLIKAH
jgi:hypothetical protein